MIRMLEAPTTKNAVMTVNNMVTCKWRLTQNTKGRAHTGKFGERGHLGEALDWRSIVCKLVSLIRLQPVIFACCCIIQGPRANGSSTEVSGIVEVVGRGQVAWYADSEANCSASWKQQSRGTPCLKWMKRTDVRSNLGGQK
jgi:hypothetical protein